MPRLRHFASLIALATLGACATVSRLTIADRLTDLGLDSQQAGCMADKLDDQLDDAALGRLARLLDQLRAEARPDDVLRAIDRASDPEIAKAVGLAGVACLFG